MATPPIFDTTNPGERRLPCFTLSGIYLVSLHDDVDLPTFKAALPADIQSNIMGEWCALKAKGIGGMCYLSPSFQVCISLLTRPGFFDEAARNYLSAHSDVKSVDESGPIITTVARNEKLSPYSLDGLLRFRHQLEVGSRRAPCKDPGRNNLCKLHSPRDRSEQFQVRTIPDLSLPFYFSSSPSSHFDSSGVVSIW